MISLRRRCCTTPGAAIFWATSFLVLYGAGLLMMRVWPDLGRYDSAVLLAALGIACLANVARSGTYHCGLTGPLFLTLAAAVALDAAGILDVPAPLVWAAALIGTGAALFLEYRFNAGGRRA